ncbi:MAG TPA: ferrochelatase [Gammaproteobacteria bacterium]|nr:ferrochelatase [Gammaproteobacteria bacterium]
MNDLHANPDFRHDSSPCTGVLLVNLGTPDTPDTGAVRDYLAEFLWDPRVVDVARPLWWLALHGVILRIRPARVAKAYRSIWTEEGSPLLSVSRKLTAQLRQRYAQRDSGRVEVALAMRYGKPAIETALLELEKKGMRRLLVLPLYPQYSSTTTAAVFDELARVLGQWRWLPDIRFVQHYHDHPAYIEALADSIREHWETQGRSERLLMSFHGIPERMCRSGDPYYCECVKTARLLAARLDLAEAQWKLTFQSRFGREPWLQPYTDITLKEWASQGVQSVDVVCPGFSADCLETLEEINGQNRELFLAAGGRQFSYIAALNDRAQHVEALAQLIDAQLQGWQPALDDAPEHLAACRERALADGAGQ